MAWNAKDAFWKVEGIFDEVAGQTGTFDAVIEGIQDDPLGPKIDIKNDVMPYLTSEIYSASDCVEPITPDSKRSLIAIRITDADKLSAVLERAMKNEPHATSVEYKDHKIWKVSIRMMRISNSLWTMASVILVAQSRKTKKRKKMLRC